MDGATAYTYDGEGRRVIKLPGGSLRMVYDVAGRLVAEFDGATGALRKEYVYGAVSPAATIEPSGGTLYTTCDTLGTPRVITGAGGTVAGRHDYMPFGEELWAGAGPRGASQGYGVSDGLRQKFTGYERDAETGLDYAQARYYGSTQGRFTSADPLHASAVTNRPQTWNRYSYALNNPLRFVDPNGLSPQDTGKKEEVTVRVVENENEATWTNYFTAAAAAMVWKAPALTTTAATTGGGTTAAAGVTGVTVTSPFVVPAAGLLTFAGVAAAGHAAPTVMAERGMFSWDLAYSFASPGYIVGQSLIKDMNKEKALPVPVPVPVPDTATPPNRPDLNMIVVRGGTADLPGPGTVFSGAVGSTLYEAAAAVPHGTIRTSTVRAIIDSGGSVILAPELTRGGNMNFRHVNIVEGAYTTFSPPFPNPVPKDQRIK